MRRACPHLAVCGLLLAVLLAAHHQVEAAGVEAEVFLLEEGGLGAYPEMGEGAGSGSGSGSAASLKKPYENHMDANKPKWSQLGGWNHNHDKMLVAAKKQLARAESYLKKKKHEKTISEMGCPCLGEKYYEDVFGSTVPVSQRFPAGSAAGSADSFDNLMKKDKEGGENGKLSEKMVQRYIKKYGKLGPNSSWQPKHETEKKKAGKELKAAEVEEDAAFKLAIPEFKQFREEEPAFFANGDCKCPDDWTLADSAALSAKEAKDVEAAFLEFARNHRYNMSVLDGTQERLMKKEQKGEKPDDQMPNIESPTVKAKMAKYMKEYRWLREAAAERY